MNLYVQKYVRQILFLITLKLFREGKRAGEEVTMKEYTFWGFVINQYKNVTAKSRPQDGKA